MKKLVFLILLSLGIAYGGISITPYVCLDDVLVSTLHENGAAYSLISIEGFYDQISSTPGHPMIPASYRKFILPPGSEIDNITLTDAVWEAIDLSSEIYPYQNLTDPEAVFVPCDPSIFSSSVAYPQSPVFITGQGSMSGIGVATICITPLRYIPSEDRLEVLVSGEIEIQYTDAKFEAVTPFRSTALSAERRLAGIRASVHNSEDISLYPPVNITEHEGNGALSVTEAPSIYGDAVDFVIITVDDHAADFEDLAEKRTQQGIITVVRYVDWIESTYPGIDTPQKIRNFLCDAHEYWGTEFVLLGGEEEDVPDRLIETSGGSPGCDDVPFECYYADCDGNWNGLVTGQWVFPAQVTEPYLELSVARLPIDTTDDFYNFFIKLNEYENPTLVDDDDEYLKRLCSLTTEELGTGQYRAVEWFKNNSDWMSLSGGPVTSFYSLYSPETSTIGYPLVLSGADDYLTRSNALEVFDQAYNIIIHLDHSGIHQMGMGSNTPYPNALYESDFSNMNNSGHPFILFSTGCYPGHFNGAECILEHSLFASSTTGAVASIGPATASGSGSAFSPTCFIDAFYPFFYQYPPTSSEEHDPMYFVGEGWKHQFNFNHYLSFKILFGDPTMFVWRDMPEDLVVTGIPTSATAGTPFSCSITVTDGTNPVEDATVVLWQEDELYSTATTNSSYSGPRKLES